MIKRPMLASNDAIRVTLTGLAHNKQDWDAVQVHLPMMLSNKLDGIRLLTHPEIGPCTREFLEIPNDHIRTTIARICPNWLDGEVMTYNADGSRRTFNEIQGDVMRKAGKPDFKFHVFDEFRHPQRSFFERYNIISKMRLGHCAELVLHHEVTTIAQIQKDTREALASGFEGTMLRKSGAIYKEGRSTLKQGWLLKVKHFLDAEGTIIGFEEQLKNNNPKQAKATGGSKRSSHKANKTPMGTLGALVLSTEFGELRVGNGWTKEMRQKIWDTRTKRLGDIVTYTYQPSGAKNKPRFPIFKGFRLEFKK
jgi:DNA ligase-1